MDLSIIIVNWNSKDYLRKCIASILAETHDLQYEIIVIDSASYDGCDRMLREEYPQVRFIQSTANLGFARANNLAFAASKGKAVLFLNPDTEVCGPAIQLMHKQLWATRDAGVVGCKLLNSDGSIQTSCIQSFPTILNQLLDTEPLRRRFPRSDLWGMAPLLSNNSTPQVAEAISGACVMLKRDVFESVGRFSMDYFMYAEDIDLSYKVQGKGYKNYFVPAAVVFHHGGGSSQKVAKGMPVVMYHEAVWRFLRKFRGNAYACVYRVITMLTALARLACVVPIRARHFFKKELPVRWRAYYLRWYFAFVWSFGLSRVPQNDPDAASLSPWTGLELGAGNRLESPS
jgi:N-acetylglucosaminyl-diphospho-decaprenol L-rhamnosyltransferase